jgi:general stress protein YciG
MAQNQGNKGENRGGDASKRGFASMDPEQQKEIASKGGKAAHESGNAHEFDSDEAREAGKKGGEAVSRDREHMRKAVKAAAAAIAGASKHD